MFGIVTKTKRYFTHYKRIFKLFRNFNSPGFEGEVGPGKSFFSKVFDYLFIFFVLKRMPDNYQIYGFDTKNREEFKNYIGDPWNEPFLHHKIGKLWRNGVLLRDKQFFKIICDHYRLPVPRSYGFIKQGKLEGEISKAKELIAQYQPKQLVIKPVLGQNGVGIQFFEANRLEEVILKNDLGKEDYIIEEAIEQHPEMDRFNPHSVNSIRLITFLCPDGSVELLTGMLKTSASRTPIDNFSLGGIAIGIDLETGKVKKNGYAKFYSHDAFIDNRKSTDKDTIEKILNEIERMQAKYPGKIFQYHPLTGLKFEGFQLPYWEEIVKTSIRSQQIFCHGKANAMDIAITANGPVILEGNEDWGTAGIQAANGGLLTLKNVKLFAQYGIKFY